MMVLGGGGGNLSISEYFQVGFGSGQPQLDQVLLEGGVHVHSICLLTFCLHEHHTITLAVTPSGLDREQRVTWGGGGGEGGGGGGRGVEATLGLTRYTPSTWAVPAAASPPSLTTCPLVSLAVDTWPGKWLKGQL